MAAVVLVKSAERKRTFESNGGGSLGNAVLSAREYGVRTVQTHIRGIAHRRHTVFPGEEM